MTEKETMTIKISFNAEIDPKSFDEISRIVSNHLDYMIAFDDYPEIKAYFNAKVETVK